MGLIHIYDTISNEHETITKTGELKSILPVFDFSKAIILKAGEKMTPEYIVEPDDIIYIRKYPGDLVTFGIIAGFIAVGAVAGTLIGVAKDRQESLQAEQEKAQRDAQNLAAATTQLPFIRGAKNQSALGQPLQYLLGRMYNTPYLLTNAFYSIEGTDGEQQYLNLIMSLGAGAQNITEVHLGDTVIKKNEAGLPSGTMQLDENAKYTSEENQNNLLEIRQPGEAFTAEAFTKAVKSHYSGAEIVHEHEKEAEPLIITLDDYTQAVEIGLEFKSLRKYDIEHSTWTAKEVEIIPYWSNDDNPDPADATKWHAFSFDGFTNNKISKNKNHTIRYKASKTFTAAEAYGKKITIKIVKVNPAAESNTQEAAYLSYYNCFLYDNERSTSASLQACSPAENEITSRTARLGLKIIANSNTQNTLDEIHTISTGRARTWNGTNWTTAKTATRNPAAWIYELLTTDVHEHSRYNDDEIDTASLGALYEYCENPLGDNSLKYYCDALITQGQKKDDIINNILATVDAIKYTNRAGKIEFAIDKAEATPVALLNAQNITGINYTKDLNAKPDGKKVTFIDGDTFQTTTVYSMRNNKTREADDVITTLNLDYVKTYKHAVKLAQKELRAALLQPKTITIDVGREGDYYPIFSTILLQYGAFKTGLRDSQIESVTSAKVTLKDLVTMETGKRYGVIIQAQTNAGRRLFYREVTGAKSTRTLTFTQQIINDGGVLPQYNNIVSFGELNENGQFDKVTDTMKIYGIEPNGAGGYQLTLKNYNAAIYELGTIPAYKPNITQPPKAAASIPEVTRADLNAAISHTDEAINNFYSSHIITLYKRSNRDLTSAGITSGLVYNFGNNTLEWDDEEGANGWKFTREEVEDGDGLVYITQATAYGKTTEDTVESNEWARPVPFAQNGQNGYNSYTIQLFRRYAGTPPKPAADLVYNFSNATMTGELAGWSRSIPAVDDDNLPCYEIHATALSTTDADTITPEEWSNPEQILKDSNITLAEVQELINNAAPPPVASAEATTVAFQVNDENTVTAEQSTKIKFHVRQTGEELQFTFGSIQLPAGLEYSTDGNELTITAKKGAKITAGNINVPVQFYAYKSNVINVDEAGRQYIADNVEIIAEPATPATIPANPADTNVINWTGSDTTSELVDGGLFEANTAYQYDSNLGKWKKFVFTPYGYFIFEDTASVFNIGIAYQQVKGGSNRGPVSSLSAEILDNAIIGDYITWTGTTTASTKQTDGTFKAGAVYTWNGQKWDIDTSDNHTALSLNNILDVTAAELEQNNATAVGLFQKIAVNEVIAAKLTVTGSAFMNKLYAANIYSDIFTSYDESAQSYATAAKNEAVNTASADATSKANAAQTNATNAAALDASQKAAAAQSAAEDAASLDASTKANAAKAAAISTAAADATTKANTAQATAEANAAKDAKTKADAAEKNAKGYADTQKTAAEATASGYTKAALEALGLNVNNDRTIIAGSKISTGLINAAGLVITGDETLGNYLSDMAGDIGKKADASSVYTKTETDGLLGTKANASSLSNYATKAAAIVETKTIYYKKTNSTAPGTPTHASIKTTDTENAWSYKVPAYKDGATYYTATEYKHADGKYSYTAASLDNELSKQYAATNGVTIVAGGYIATDLVNADSIKAGAIETDHLAAGAVTTDKLEAGAITAEKIDADSLKATEGFFDNIEATGAKFTEVEVSGTVNATRGRFDGYIGTFTDLGQLELQYDGSYKKTFSLNEQKRIIDGSAHKYEFFYKIVEDNKPYIYYMGTITATFNNKDNYDIQNVEGELDENVIIHNVSNGGTGWAIVYYFFDFTGEKPFNLLVTDTILEINKE